MRHSKGITVGTYTIKTKKKVNTLPILVTIYTLGCQMEEIKKSRGKIGTNAYRTNMSTLKRISNYDFANIPIEKVKRESIEDFLEDERNKSNSIIKKDYGMLARIYDYAEENDYIKKNFFRGFNKIEKTQSKIATKQVNPMTFDEENSYLKKVAKEVGLSYWKQFSSHRLRHTFATRCIEAGISLPVLQTLMGHHDIQTTINEYGKVFNFYQRKEKEKYINYVTDGISKM